MPHRSLTPEERETLLVLGSPGTGAPINLSAMVGLIGAGMIEVSDDRRVILTVRGELAYARLTDCDSVPT